MAAPSDKAAMRVLIVLASSNRRGAEVEGSRLASELRERGVHAEAVALAPGSGSSLLDVPVLGRKPLGASTLRALRSCSRRFDVVVAYGSSSLPACALSLSGTGVPFIYRSIGDPTAWVRGRMHRWRTGILIRRAVHVVALWPDAAKSIRQLFSIDAERVSVIQNARSNTEFRPPTDAERTDARDGLGLPSDGLVVGCIGAISAEKRVDLAIEAVAAIEEAVVLVVGDGPYRATVEKLAQSRLAERALFTGAMESVTEIYWAIDVLLLTSATEGMPGVMIEAAMSGVPVVACDVGAVRWLFDSGVQGEIVPVDADIQELRAALSRSARKLRTTDAAAVDVCTWAMVVDQWIDLVGASTCLGTAVKQGV